MTNLVVGNSFCVAVPKKRIFVMKIFINFFHSDQGDSACSLCSIALILIYNKYKNIILFHVISKNFLDKYLAEKFEKS